MRALAPEGFIAYEHDAFMRWVLMSRPKQAKLEIALRRVCRPALSSMLSADSVLVPQRCHEPRQALRVVLGQKGSCRVPLPVAIDQRREVLFEKRKKHRRRTRFQKQRIGKNVFRPGAARGL